MGSVNIYSYTADGSKINARLLGYFYCKFLYTNLWPTFLPKQVHKFTLAWQGNVKKEFFETINVKFITYHKVQSLKVGRNVLFINAMFCDKVQRMTFIANKCET